MLDIIEHLREPEEILKKIRKRYSGKEPQIILTTGNIAFLPIRLGLLAGQFNYGKRGILDLDHTRLFTFYSLRRILNQAGYESWRKEVFQLHFTWRLEKLRWPIF